MKAKQKRVFIISYIVVIFLMFLYTTLATPLANLDEVWNFNISKEIAKGNIVYKDISLITTPLFYFINAIPLKIIANELIVYRVMEAILIAIMCYLTFNIFKKINENEYIAFVTTSLLMLLIYEKSANNYNYLSIVWLLLIINLEISKIDKNKNWYNLLIGLIAGCTILTKQTVGILIAGIIVLKILLEITEKKEIKQAFINILFRILGIIIPILLFIIYCLATNCLNDFIDYTVLGISTFSNSISLVRYFRNVSFLKKTGIVLIILLSIIGLVYIIYNRIKNKKPCRVTMIMTYALSSIILMYPIADDEHFILAFYVWIIVALIEAVRILEKVKKIGNNKILDICINVIYVFFGLLVVFNIYLNLFRNIKTYNIEEKQTQYKYYKNIIITDGIKERIDAYCNLYNEYKMQGKELCILDSDAAVYIIPTDSYRKNYDMFNNGNFGGKGEDGIIENIKNENGKVYLVKGKDQKKNWQTPTKILEYIYNNLNHVDNKVIYEVYEK